MPDAHPLVKPTFRVALRFWLKLGFISFGGPTGQIAILHTEVVERRRWMTEERFLHALNFCMLLPGPEAQQLAAYIGWWLHGTKGGVVAGALFVIPSVFILLTLSWVYAAKGNLPWVAAIFWGLKPAVLAIVAFAVVRIGQKALKTRGKWALAGAAFVAIYFGQVPFPFIILAAALIGLISGAKSPTPARTRGEPISLRRAARLVAVCLTLWWGPVILLGWWQGWDSVFVKQGVFFSKAALVTFGGAYAVLPYVAQAAVEQYGWLSATQMMDGLALAETTPGPLIMVLQFVGFMGGWQHAPAGMPVGLAAVIGALVTTWVTFTPCFLWILLGAPFVERLYGNPRLNAALSAVTAAVVGVILNLAVWFAVQTLWPGRERIEWLGLLMTAVALWGLWHWRWGVVPVVLVSGALGLLVHLLAR